MKFFFIIVLTEGNSCYYMNMFGSSFAYHSQQYATLRRTLLTDAHILRTNVILKHSTTVLYK